MRNELKTAFWKNALQSLPARLRWRYVHDIEAAELWEHRIGAIVEAWSHAKAALTRFKHRDPRRRSSWADFFLDGVTGGY